MVQTSPTGTSCSAKNAAIDGPRTVPTASPFYDNLSLLLLGAPPKPSFSGTYSLVNIRRMLENLS